jgi:hypothetical protein
MSTPIYEQVREVYESGGLGSVFRDILGWDAQTEEQETFSLREMTVTGKKVASMLSSIAVFEFDFTSLSKVSPQTQHDISKAIAIRYVEHILIINTREGATWLWPKKTTSGTLTHEKLFVPLKSMPLFLAQRLAGLRYTSLELFHGLTVASLRDKIRGSFDTGTVTKKFYEEAARSTSDINFWPIARRVCFICDSNFESPNVHFFPTKERISQQRSKVPSDLPLGAKGSTKR